MPIFYRDSSLVVVNASCSEMKELPDGFVHCVVTSPPYWSLRKYAGVPDSVWDDGWTGQLGQEPTPELYIKHLVDIFKEVRRVLRSDGTCWINIGDSYAGNAGNAGGYYDNPEYEGKSLGSKESRLPRKWSKHPVLKPADKCLIPFRLAIALQEDGWWIRQDVIWNKPNPMPESVRSPAWVKHRVKIKDNSTLLKKQYETVASRDGATIPGLGHMVPVEWQDCPGCPKCLPNEGLILRHGSWRPTEAHEYILMLAKSQDYFCDGEAVREPQELSSLERCKYSLTGFQKADTAGDLINYINPKTEKATRERTLAGAGRNLRSVWTFATQSYPGAHYATFPEKLPELAIKAGTSEYGVCAECGKPYARIIQNKPMVIRRSHHAEESGIRIMSSGTMEEPNEVTTLGWKACCSCKTDKPPVPSVVLDPFAGTGTTLAVARQLRRRAIGYELSLDYCKLIVNRQTKEEKKQEKNANKTRTPRKKAKEKTGTDAEAREGSG